MKNDLPTLVLILLFSVITNGPNKKRKHYIIINRNICQISMAPSHFQIQKLQIALLLVIISMYMLVWLPAKKVYIRMILLEILLF